MSSPILALPKSLVEVAIGALAFFCGMDRRAMPITKTLASLSVFMCAWATLAILSVATPLLIGGETASERFGELAPVLVLSSPALWGALRVVQIHLELLDTMLGVVALVRRALASLHGVWDAPQSLARAYVLRASVNSQFRSDSDRAKLAFTQARVQANSLSVGERGRGFALDDSRVELDPSAKLSEYDERVTVRWETEVLPLGARVGLLPFHRKVQVRVEEVLQQPPLKMAPETDSESDESFTRNAPSSGVIGAFRSVWRRVMFWARLAALKVPSRATLHNSVITLDNLQNGWIVSPTSASRRRALIARRAIPQWPAALVRTTQAVVNIGISFVDSIVGELGAFVLVLALEMAHPLRVRRDNAVRVLRGKCAIVAAIEKRHADCSTMGFDRYIRSCADVVLLQSIATILGGRLDLMAQAFVMMRVGALWRSREESFKFAGAGERSLLPGADNWSAVLPRIHEESVDAMIMADSEDEQVADDMIDAVSRGEQPMVLICASILKLAIAKGADAELPVSSAASMKYAGLRYSQNASVKTSSQRLARQFCRHNGWSVSLFSVHEHYNWFAPDDSCSENMAALIEEMCEISLDCHAAFASVHCSWREWATVPHHARIRHKMTASALTANIDKIEQHDFLVSCHRRVALAASWMFADNVLAHPEAPDWYSWQMWCMYEAFELAKSVWQVDVES